MEEGENVEYCKECLSLSILGDGNEPYCNVCGATDIGYATIMEWEAKYEAKYGVSYLHDNRERWKQEKRDNFNKLWK